MRKALMLSMAAIGLAIAAVAVRAGDDTTTPADALFARLVAPKAADRAKADTELAAADHDTLATLARRLRDEFAPKPARLATTTLGVEVQSYWITLKPELIGPLLGVSPDAATPQLSSASPGAVKSATQKTEGARLLNAPTLTVYDGQQAMASILNRTKDRPSSYSTGVVLGFRPTVTTDGKAILLDFSFEARHLVPGATLGVAGASWRTDLSIANDGDALIVFPAAFALEPDQRRLALLLHLKSVQLPASVIGSPINEFDVSFGGDERSGSSR